MDNKESFGDILIMSNPNTLDRYLKALLEGDRQQCRTVIEETLQSGIPANSVCSDVIWPIMKEIEHLNRTDKISIVQEHLATRINRTIVDQLQNKLPRRPVKNKKVVVCCAPEELQELGAQITADLFESEGWDVRFIGGGLTNDDILGYVNEWGPEVLLIYGTKASQAPDVRRLIDRIKGVNAWPDMQILVSGGLFNRAEGLWEEIGADMFAENAVKAVLVASGAEPVIRSDEGRTINRRKRRRERVGHLETMGV